MNKTDKDSKHIIDEIAEKANKEINSLEKIKKDQIAMNSWVMVGNIESLADRIGVSRDALLLVFSQLILQSATETKQTSEDAELKLLADSLVQASIKSERTRTGRKNPKKIIHVPHKNGYIQ